MSLSRNTSILGALSALAVASACGTAVRPAPLVSMGAHARADLSSLEDEGWPLVLVGQTVYRVPEHCIGAPRIGGTSVARAEGPSIGGAAAAQKPGVGGAGVDGGPRVDGAAAPAPAPPVSGASASRAPGVSGGSARAAERSPGYAAASAAPVVTCVPLQGGRAFQLSGAVSGTVDIYLGGRVIEGVPASRVDLDALERRDAASGPASP